MRQIKQVNKRMPIRLTMFEKQKLEFEKALELRNFEIDNFWKRGWFFGALLIALITGLTKLKNLSDTYSACVSFIALLVSLGQSLMNRGSKYWQERWEYVTKNKESALKIDVTKTRKFKSNKGNGIYNDKYYIDTCIRAKGENRFMQSSRFSVSKITILIWDIITFSFLFIWLDKINVLSIFSPLFSINDVNWVAFSFHILVIVYLALVIFIRGKVHEKLLHKKPTQHQRLTELYNESEDYVEDNEDKLRM